MWLLLWVQCDASNRNFVSFVEMPGLAFASIARDVVPPRGNCNAHLLLGVELVEEVSVSVACVHRFAVVLFQVGNGCSNSCHGSMTSHRRVIPQSMPMEHSSELALTGALATLVGDVFADAVAGASAATASTMLRLHMLLAMLHAWGQ